MSTSRHVVFALVITLASLGFFSTATADEHGPQGPLPEFYQGLRSTGAGNSHVAVASGVDALFQNPAGMARGARYVFDGAFSYTPQAAIMGAGIADSYHNANLAGGVAYNYVFGMGDHSHLSGHDIRGGLAIPVVHERVAIGFGVRYLLITDSLLPEPVDEDDDQLLINGPRFDMGVNFRPTDLFHVGLAIQNVNDSCSDDVRCKGATPTRVSGGIAVGEETNFLASAQASIDLTSADTPLFDFGVGAEYLAAGAIPIRAGFERRAFHDRNMITIGAGWRSEKVGVDFSYRHDVAAMDQFGYFSGGFSLYVF